jgi:hypothetical protein
MRLTIVRTIWVNTDNEIQNLPPYNFHILGLLKIPHLKVHTPKSEGFHTDGSIYLNPIFIHEVITHHVDGHLTKVTTMVPKGGMVEEDRKIHN